MISRSILLFGLLFSTALAAETVVIRNVHGYALTPSAVEQFDALVSVDGKIDRVFKSPNAPSLPSGATVIDGKGKTLLPGLIDAHGHVLELGKQSLEADLRGSLSVDDALERVRRFAAVNKSDRWIVGRGWNQVLWPSKKFPTAKDLDAIVRDRPAILSRVDGHAIWVNSAALRLAAITKDTPDPSGGEIIRDTNGSPTGVLVDNATALVERHLSPPTPADIARALKAALLELSKNGLTGVHDAGIEMRDFAQYEELGKRNQLPVRVYAMLADSKSARERIKAGPIKSEFDDRLQLSAVKAWVDGALGSRGAALIDDYSDQPGHRGLKLYSQEDMIQLAKLTGQYGWQLNVHAIGDEGNRIALNAFEQALTQKQREALRPRIEHAQVISLTDIPRFASLGMIASIQPTHATSDMNMAEDRLGSERIKGAYAWRKLKNAHVRLAGGSDFPVELVNPFHGLYAAVTRKSREGQPPGGWHAEEKLTREEALRLFTVDAAFAAHMESRVGGLQPGEWADFILIDRDYFAVPEDQIDDIVVNEVYLAAKKMPNGLSQ